MESCKYEVVASNNESNSTSGRVTFLRQLLVCSGVWTSIFLLGLVVGAPTVYIPQIRKEANSTTAITDDMASWLTSVSIFSGSIFVVIVFLSIRLIGRRILYMIGTADCFIAFLVLYHSSNYTQILISSIMQGLFTGLQVVLAIMVLTEYTSPKYRGLFLTIKSATLYWGIWASNAIGTFFHWKIIPLCGIACALFSFVTMIMWPESPYWLSSKGKFRECAASHRWLKGNNEESERELEALITLQKEYIASYDGVKFSIKNSIIGIFRTIISKEFYKPTTLAVITGLLYIFSGKYICTMYAIDIIKKITNSESTAYIGMLILDGITVLSMYGGCILARFLNRRTLLLLASAVGVAFLYILSIYLYIIKLSVIVENKYVTISLLTLFSIAVSCGPVLITSAVYGELIPIRSRNLSACIISFLCNLFMAIALKVAPLLFKTTGLHGTFLIFGIMSSIAISILYKYLPETKDKTLKEIADSLNG